MALALKWVGTYFVRAVLNHLLPQWGSQSGHLWAQELNRKPLGILLPSSLPCQALRWRAAILKKAKESFFFFTYLGTTLKNTAVYTNAKQMEKYDTFKISEWLLN